MSSITYSSTRGSPSQQHLDFRTVVMQGLARDGGLFIPDQLPSISSIDLEKWRDLNFSDMATQVLRKFIQDDQVPYAKLQEIVSKSCAAFRHEDVTPLVQVGGHYVLELYHGPTFAFKDVALQMLGNFFEYFLQTGSNGRRLAVLGATSGDTGSAAIAGLRGKQGVDCIILFPNGRVSAIQERQMTTILDHNIHCVAIEGTFDDCQDLVKASFNSPAFREEVHLGAVNSINWCRVLVQTTYYVWSYLRVTESSPRRNGKRAPKVNFSVPTGNFGDILAGYYAKNMGVPVGKLVVATNENDILHRFFSKGEYHREDIQHSISPSMDICVSSNFERYLFHLAGNDATKLAGWMKDFEQSKELTLTGEMLTKAQSDFMSARADTTQTLQTIADYSEKYDFVLCPHSAVGVSAVHQLGLLAGKEATVCLATAHEGKFPAAVRRAVDPLPPPPLELAALSKLPTRRTELPNDLHAVQSFVRQCVGRRKSKWIQVAKNLVTLSAMVAGAAVIYQAVTMRRH